MPLVKHANAADSAPPQGERSYADLVRDLRAGDARARRGTARALAEFPAAASELCAAAVAETNESVRESIFTALMRIGTPAVAAGLVPMLQSDDVALRNAAIEALRHMPKVLARHMEEILAGPTRTRILGIAALSTLAHPDNLHWLIRIVEDEADVNVCAAAVDVIIEHGDRQAVAPLERLLKRFPNEPFLEFSIRTALAQIASL